MDQFKTILDALVKEGFHHLPDRDPGTGKPFDFKFTPYSLNTKLSFKFDNLEHFIRFLEHSRADTSPEKLEMMHSKFSELGLDPSQFFYVNFFERGKEVEM